MYCKWSLIGALLTIVISPINVNAQVPSFGKCPEVQVMTDFQPKQYIGIWYEYEKYPFVFELLGKCIFAEYGQHESGLLSVVNSQINRITGNKSNITGTAEVIEPGKLLVKFPGAPVKADSNYWILGTDYKSYAVVFTCSEAAKVVNGKVVWILTRDRHPLDSVIKSAYEIMEKNKLSKSFLIKTDQSECPEE